MRQRARKSRKSNRDKVNYQYLLLTLYSPAKSPTIIQNHSARTGYKDTVAPGRPVPMAAGQSVMHCHIHVIPRYAPAISTIPGA